MKKNRFVVTVLAIVFLVLPGMLIVAGCSDDEEIPAGLLAVWQLQEFRLDSGAVTAVADPARYTVEFEADGNASVKSDCNRCSGSYTVSGSRLTFGPMACTLVACAADSLDSAFNSALATTSNYEIRDGQLYLGYTGGQMRLAQ